MVQKLITVLIVFLAVPVVAKWQFTPAVSLTSTNYFDPLSTNVNENLDAFRASLEVKSKFNNYFRIKLRPFLQYDPLNLSQRERLFWDVPEAYIEVKTGSFALQVGENIIAWSGTDGFNPVDIVNARRLYDPINSEKIGAASLLAKWGVETVDVQIFFIPWQAKSQLPGESSRWLPRDIYIPNNNSVQFILPPTLNYSYSPDVELDSALQNNFGGHLQFHLGGSDLALMYFEGASSTPTVVPTISGTATVISTSGNVIVQGNSNFILQPVFYRVRVSGLTSTVSLPFETLLKVSASYTQPVSVGLDVPAWYYNTVIGFEHNFSLGKGSLAFVPQFAYAQHADAAGSDVSSLSRLFDRAALLGLRYSPEETWAITASGLYDFLQSDKSYGMDVIHNFSDHFKIDLNGNYLVGAPGTPLGSYSRNSRVLLSFIWQN